MNIKIEKDGSFATIIISNKEKKNSLNEEIFLELNKQIKEIERDKSIEIIFLKGDGENFSSGVSLEGLIKFLSTEDARDFAILMEDTISNLFNTKKITIALVDGYALGGGLALALACDIRIFTNRAKLGIPAVKIGAIFPANSTRRLIADIGLSRTKDLLLTGKIISSLEGKEIGIVNYLVDYPNLELKGKEIAKKILKGSPLALELTKQTANNLVETNKITYSSDNFAFLYSTAQWHKRIWNFLNKKK